MDRSLPEHLWEQRTPDNSKMIAWEWRDIRTTDHWTDDSESVRPARRIVSAGYLLYDGVDPHDGNAEIIIIGNHYDYEEGRWSEFTCYPKSVPRRYPC